MKIALKPDEGMLTTWEEALLQRGTSSITIGDYRWIIAGFLRDIGGTPDWMEAVRQYIKSLPGKPNTIRTKYYAVKSLYKVHGLPWPADLLPPSVDPLENESPYIEPDEVKTLIAWGINHGDPLTQAHLALSTLYGLRTREIALIGPSHIEKGILSVPTLKGGLRRRQLIPDEVKEVLAKNAVQPCPVSTLSSAFGYYCARAGVKRVKGEGWKAIRRCLYTELQAARKRSTLNIYPEDIRLFFRWRPRDVADIYYRRLSPRDDLPIFEIHPFLGAWRGRKHGSPTDQARVSLLRVVPPDRADGKGRRKKGKSTASKAPPAVRLGGSQSFSLR